MENNKDTTAKEQIRIFRERIKEEVKIFERYMKHLDYDIKVYYGLDIRDNTEK